MTSSLKFIALMFCLALAPVPSARAAEAVTQAPDKAALQKELADLQAKLKALIAKSTSLKREAKAARAQHAAALANGKIDSHLAVASCKEAENQKVVNEMTPVRSRISVLQSQLDKGTPKKKKNAKKKKK